MQRKNRTLEHIILSKCLAECKFIKESEILELAPIFLEQPMYVEIDWIRGPVFWNILKNCKDKTLAIVKENVCYDIVHWGNLRFPFLEQKEAFRLIYEKCTIEPSREWSLVIPSSALICLFSNDERAISVWVKRETLKEEYPSWLVDKIF